MKLTQVCQQSEEFISQDGVVLVLVVELEDFHEVVDATGVLGVLGLFEDGVEVIEDHDLLSLLALTAELVDGGQSGVEVAGPQQVADVEAIDLTISLEVIDVKSETDFWRGEKPRKITSSLYFEWT